LVWVADHELWLLAPAIPPLVFPEVIQYYLVISAFIYLVVLWICRWLARGYISVRTPMDIPIATLLAMLPLSLYASVDISLSLPKLTGILLGVAVYYAIVNTTQSRVDVRKLLLLLVLAGGAIAVVGLLGTDWSGKFPVLGALYERLPRVINRIPHAYAEGAIHPNELGGTIATFVPLVASLALTLFSSETYRDFSTRTRTTLQILSFAMLLLMGLTLILTQSRSAWIGVTIALMIIGGVRYRWLRSVLVAGIVLVVALVLNLGAEHIGRLLFDVSSSTTRVGTLDLAGRVEVWQRAIYMLQDFPYTGIGLNTFSVVVNILYPFFLIGPDAKVPHAHNLLLQTGVDLGLPGLAAYCGLVAAFCMSAGRSARTAQNSVDRAILVGLLAGMLAFQVYGLTDAITLGAKPGIVMWVATGLVAVLNSRGWVDA